MKKIILYGFVICAVSAAAFVSEARATPAQDGDADVYQRDGVRYALEGRLDEAAAAFRQAVRLDPKNGDAFYSLGNVYAEQGRWAEAVGAYRMAVVLRKRDGEAYNGLGLALGGLGEYEEAAAAFLKAVEIFPAWAEPRFHLSRVYAKLGREVAAQVAYSEALERRPDYASHPPRSFMSEIVRTRVEPRDKRPAMTAAVSAAPPAAEKVNAGARVVARTDANESVSPYELGLRHSRAGRLDEAANALRQAVRLDRNNAAAHSALGSVYAQLGRWRESVDAYEQAVRLDPQDSNTYEMLGRSYAKLREMTPTTTPAGGADDAAVGVRAGSTSGATADATPSAGRNGAAVGANNVTSERPAVTSRPAVAAAAMTTVDADPASVYRVGPGDVLEVRAPGAQQSRLTAYKISPTGLLDYPQLGGPLKVVGLTTDEIAARLGAELKRRGVADAEVSVGVREYESHAVIVSGLVRDPGTKILRREGVPLYVIVAHAQPLAEAGQVLVVPRTTGQVTAVNLKDAAAMNLLVRPGDVVTVQALPKQFYFVAGAVRQPGQKQFHSGLTLTQAVLAAGGVVEQTASVVTVARQGGDGRLTTTRYSLRDIEAGRAPDPVVQPGDRVEVQR